ncbi:hypothetical protein L7F22_045714 [Adiantum nelumboides]|nr:hypothetical protein [Adiantum nelumboides]
MCYRRHKQVLLCRGTSILRRQPTLLCIRTSSQQASLDDGLAYNSCEQLLRKRCEAGDLHGALDTLSQFPSPCTPHTYVALLRACSTSQVLQHALCVHTHLVRHGTAVSGSLGEHLVMALSKCGAVDDAFHVSAILPRRSAISWTALISAYASRGCTNKAFEIYQSMQDDGVEPNNYTFVSLLQVCGSSLDLERGKKLHIEARSKGLSFDPYVSSALLSMYGKCGAVVEVEATFCAVLHRDIVAWNTMLSCYVKHCQPEKALHLYRQMHAEGLSGNQLTFVITAQACGLLVETRRDFLKLGTVVCFELIRGLHADARKMGFESNSLFRNTLVSVYGKCGAVAHSYGSFLLLNSRVVISWNAMLTAYVGQGLAYESLQLYMYMHEEGTIPDRLTFLVAFQACFILLEEACLSVERCLQVVQALHTDTCLTDYAEDVIVATPLLMLYAKCGRMTEAEDCFSSLPYRDVVTWTAMLFAHVEQEQAKKAMQLYVQMQNEEISPNQLTCISALQACGMLTEKEYVRRGASARVTSLSIGHALHADACLRGFISDIRVATAIVCMYAKCSSFLEVEAVFNTMPERDTVAWNAMLSACVDLQQGEDALFYYTAMEQERVFLDDGTIVSLLQASSGIGCLDTVRQLHFTVVFEGFDAIPSVAATLIDSYGSCGNMAEADICLHMLPEPDLIVCTACLCGHVGHGDALASMALLEGMKAASNELDDVILSLVLTSCSRAGLVVECLHYFNVMNKDRNTEVNINFHGILLDLFGRAGDFKRINSIIKEMPAQADVTIWLSLLGASHTHGNIELANLAFDHAVIMAPKETSAYVLRSNAATLTNVLQYDFEM